MADPGEGPGGPNPPPPLFLDQTEARRAEKNFLETPHPLSKGLDDQAPPPPLSQGLHPALECMYVCLTCRGFKSQV